MKRGIEAEFPKLWRYCFALTHNRQNADDLAQTACLRAIEKATQFTPGTNLKAWLFTIANRTWLNELRAQTIRKGGGLVPIEESGLFDKNLSPEMNSLGREVLNHIMALPEAQRAVVVLVYVEGYRYREAAEILDVPVGTIMSRLSAARLRLTSIFEEKAKIG